MQARKVGDMTCPRCGWGLKVGTPRKPRLLDLFCGAGGAAMGYHRAGFEVVGVDIKPQPHYPFEFYQADAMTFPLGEFDVIHASPPCQAYCKQTGNKYRNNHPRLIESVRGRMNGIPYIIENVEGARSLLVGPIMLCGSMFDLPIRRHRFFEILPRPVELLMSCNHSGKIVYVTGTPRPKVGPRKDPPVAIKREALRTPWMTIAEMDEAIPPAYTEWIGKQLMKHFQCGPGTYNWEYCPVCQDPRILVKEVSDGKEDAND